MYNYKFLGFFFLSILFLFLYVNAFYYFVSWRIWLLNPNLKYSQYLSINNPELDPRDLLEEFSVWPYTNSTWWNWRGIELFRNILFPKRSYSPDFWENGPNCLNGFWMMLMDSSSNYLNGNPLSKWSLVHLERSMLSSMEPLTIILFFFFNTFYLLDWSAIKMHRLKMYKISHFLLVFFCFPFLVYFVITSLMPFWYLVHHFFVMNNFIIYKADNLFFFILFFIYNFFYIYKERYSIYNGLFSKLSI